jgi:hypothetical protein
MLRAEQRIERVYLHRAPIDMRKQRSGFLGREVTEQMRLRIYMTTHQCISRSLPKQLHSTHMPKNKPFSAAC